MRKVAFVVFDIENAIIDRFKIDIITDIKGVGFKLKLSTIDSDIESIITKVVQEKQDVNFDIHFINYAYQKSTVLEQWLEKYSRAEYRMALEYTDGLRYRYAEGKVVNLGKTEKDEYNRLVVGCTFRPTSPFFSHISNVIKIQVANVGKSYPYHYKYSYGQNIVENNEINNPYILDVPLMVKIFGGISNPTISLVDENNDEYNRVQFDGITLADGEYIIINSADRKIWGYTGGDLTDYTAYTSPSHDTFLRAKSGKSKIGVNLTPSDTGYLIGSWRQYGL